MSTDPSVASVVKSVTVDVVAGLDDLNEQEPLAQFSRKWAIRDGSYLVPGGGLFIKDSSETCSLKRQRYGVIDIYGTD